VLQDIDAIIASQLGLEVSTHSRHVRPIKKSGRRDIIRYNAKRDFEKGKLLFQKKLANIRADMTHHAKQTPETPDSATLFLDY